MRRLVLSMAVCCWIASVSADRGAWRALGGGTASGLPTLLLHQSDLDYQGAFTLPCRTSGTGVCQPGVFDGVYHRGSIAYNAVNNSLFVAGFNPGTIGEVTIETPTKPATYQGLTRGTFIQGLQEATGGLANTTSMQTGTSARVGGLLVVGAKLYGTVYSSYDANGTQTHSHFYQDLTLNSNLVGPFILSGTAFQGQGILSYTHEYLAAVPTVWRTALGGPQLTGGACISIISRTSAGPGIYSVDLETLANPATAIQLLGYGPITHYLDAPYGMSGVHTTYNGTCGITGVVFPEGTASVLFFGKIGLGAYCYGQGTTNASLDGTAVPGDPGVIYCYDPEDPGSKGDHTYGGQYIYKVWAYDAHDLAAVKAGTKQPYDPLPYDEWDMAFPYHCCQAEVIGAGYDAAHKTIYLGQQTADGTDKPIIHVYIHP